MKTDEVNILIEKAKSRKNGIYLFRDNYWAVKDNTFVAFSNPFGECYQMLGMFTVCIGKCARHKRKEVLQAWLKLI